jgi:hypothetical protein
MSSNLHKIILSTIFSIFLSGHLLSAVKLKPHDAPIENKWIPTARGGQFKDLLLPIPIINSLTSVGIWGHSNVLPRDIENGFESNDWYFWGGNPVKNDDGRYHVAICRWPASEKFQGWPKSHAAHYVSESDNPLGPYKFTHIIAGMHNPETIRLSDGTYALSGMANKAYVADKMEGPWKSAGGMKMETRGFRPEGALGANMTFSLRPDGSILAFRKNGDVTVSTTGYLGPYKMIAINSYDSNDGYAEDPVIWRSRHQYHVIYNKAQLERSCYMRSLNGIDWKNEYGYPYIAGQEHRYTNGTVNKWHELERPKVIRDDFGRASHLTMGVTDIVRDVSIMPKNGSKNHIFPLQVERLISIESTTPITQETKTIVVRIESEKGFDARTDVKVDSLRFGSDSVVNFGKGGVPINSKVVGSNLIVTFEGVHGLTHHDFDFKLLGLGKDNSLVFGYALLPGKSPTAATLITLPSQFEDDGKKVVLTSKVENYGHSDSVPQQIYLCQNAKGADKRNLLKKINIPALKSYESFDISETLPKFDKENFEYQLIVAGSPQEYWRRVDVTDKSVKPQGSWEIVPATNKTFMSSEITTKNKGDLITYTFYGTRAIVYGRVSRKEAYSMKATLDGETLGPILASYWDMSDAEILQTPLLEEGLHTLVLENTGKSPVFLNSFAYESEKNLHR